VVVSKLKITTQIKATISKVLADGSVPALDYAAGLFEEVPSDANLLYVNGFSIASGGSQSLDLSGSLEDLFGDACVFAKVYSLLVINLATATTKVVHVGGDSNHLPIFGAGADYAIVGPKGAFQVSSCLDGWTVTAGTGDIVKVANPGGGTAISVAIAILGKS
jgi:hypothetical protein